MYNQNLQYRRFLFFKVFMVMKYIINESQYNFLTESNPLLGLKRRIDKETLESYIRGEKIEFDICNDFENGFQYAQALISVGSENFLFYHTPDNMTMDEHYDALDKLINICKKWFQQSLIEEYNRYCAIHQDEYISEQTDPGDPPINRVITKLFRFLNDQKKVHKTKEALLKVIRDYLPFFGIPENKDRFILELYLHNYRKDGNYSNLTKDNYVDPRDMKGRKIPNWESNKYVGAQLPFEGSNLEGFWKQTRSGKIYVVQSYGWYPIYIFKDDIWYQIQERYSSSTGKQMNASNPYYYDKNLDSNVYLLNRNEMEKVERGATHDEIMSYKKDRFKNLIPDLTSNPVQNLRFGVPSSTIKFKISSVEESDDTFIINVDIHGVKGAIQNAEPETIENKVESKIRQNLREYLGGKIKGTPDKETIVIRFNHFDKSE